jgi:hypothetical protein
MSIRPFLLSDAIVNTECVCDSLLWKLAENYLYVGQDAYVKPK